MSNYTAPTVFKCPSCGASVAMQGDRGLCAYCGTPIERPRGLSRWLSQPTAAFAGSELPRAARAGRSVGRALVLLLVLLAAGGGFLAGRLPFGARPSQIVVLPTGGPAALKATPAPIAAGDGSLSELLLALPRDGKGADLLAYVYYPGNSRYSVALIDGGTRQARWRGPLLSKNAYQGQLALAPERVYLTDGDQLYALSRRDGGVLWQATLNVEPVQGCESCVLAVGDNVAVLAKDGGLQVFGGASGQLAWQQRLADRPRGLVAAGDRLVMLSEPEGKAPRQLSLIDAATGKATLQISPACPAAHANFGQEQIDASAPLIFSADGSSMTTVFGFFAKCAQSWDLRSGQKRWETALDDAQVPSSWYGGPLLVGERALVMSASHQLTVIELASGQARTLTTDKEYNFTPLAVADGLLIAQAAPEWDSQRQEIWGIDMQTGERRWQAKLQAHDLREQGSSGDWDWQLTRGGLAVVQVLRDDARLVVELLDPRTGASTLRQEHALDDMSMPALRNTLWSDDTAWLQIDSKIFAVDLATARIEYALK